MKRLSIAALFVLLIATIAPRADAAEGAAGCGTGLLEGKRITVEVEGDSVTVKREVDGGLQTVKLTLPAIVTTDLRLNEPRYASLPNIMKAKKKPLDTKSPSDYGVDIAPRLKTTNVSEPPVRQAGEKVEDVDALVAKIKALGIA